MILAPALTSAETTSGVLATCKGVCPIYYKTIKTIIIIITVMTGLQTVIIKVTEGNIGNDMVPLILIKLNNVLIIIQCSFNNTNLIQ